MQYYRDLLGQVPRIEAFRAAIRRVVRPDDRVLEVGTGLGTYALFAAEAGAARVWAVDGNPVVHVAETIARLNGYSGKIDFVRGWIPEVQLPEHATVLIFEDFPARLLDSRTFSLLSNLHESYLEAGARVVPAKAQLFLAPVGCAMSVDLLGEADDVAYGIDWKPSREYWANTPHHTAVPGDAVAGDPVAIGEIDFALHPEAGVLGGEASWIWDHDVVVHGLAYWFDLDLGGDQHLSNAPGAEPASWGQLLLSIDSPITVAAGAELRAAVTRDNFPDGAPGWLRWSAETAVMSGGGHEFAARPASFADLYNQSPDAVPRLSEQGKLELQVMRLTDGKRTICQIAEEVRRVQPRLTALDAQRLVVRTLAGKLEQPAWPVVTEAGG